MAAIANSREARNRRRRIIEQGSDRLAFVMGRIQTLPPNPNPTPSDADADADASSSSHPLISNDEPILTHPNSTADLPHGEAGESDSVLLNHDPVTYPYHSDAYKSRSPTPLHKHEDENEISSVPSSEVDHVQPPPDSSLDISGTKQQLQPETVEPKLFIPSEIGSAINASKSTRLCCSVAVALLVVLSYLGFSLLGSKFIKSIISFRPLYLVLVTNSTAVVARLISSKQRSFERSERSQNETSSDGDHWDILLARTLEAFLVMQNVLDAAFMDCAIYAVIVICGLSVVQT